MQKIGKSVFQEVFYDSFWSLQPLLIALLVFFFITTFDYFVGVFLIFVVSDRNKTIYLEKKEKFSTQVFLISVLPHLFSIFASEHCFFIIIYVLSGQSYPLTNSAADFCIIEFQLYFCVFLKCLAVHDMESQIMIQFRSVFYRSDLLVVLDLQFQFILGI